MTVQVQPSEDHEGMDELRVLSKDGGATWWCYDSEAPAPHMVEIPSDLFAQVEVVGATPTNLLGRILIPSSK